MQIVKKLLAGDRLALARVISVLEDRGESLEELVKELYPNTGNAFILGITGPPGAGKSTVTDKLVAKFRSEKKKVAVLAIDPSSPFSGGAILGDRIRMQSHTGDDGVYIRSLGTRGQHGGLSLSSREVVIALDAAGFDVIIVETAGVGANGARHLEACARSVRRAGTRERRWYSGDESRLDGDRGRLHREQM